MKKPYSPLLNKLNESRKEYNRILGEQWEEDTRSDFDPRGRRGGEEAPEMMPLPTCPPNGRWVTAIDCDQGATGMWPCVTVDNNIPLLGQVVEYAYNNQLNAPVYAEITNVQPAATWPNNPGIFSQSQLTSSSYIRNWPNSPTGTPCSQGTQIPGCTDPTATNYDPLATFDDGSCIFTTPCMKVTLINTCPQNSSYSTYYGTPGVPSPGGSWNMNWGQGPNFGCATIDGQTPDATNLQTFIEGGTGVPGEQWEVFSIDPPTSNYAYDLNTTSC